MSDLGDRFKPGEPAPASGFYECDRADVYRWSTDVAGHPPPPPPGRSGARWGLREKRPVQS